MLVFTALQVAPSMAVAVRAGLLILLVARAVGGWMIGHGVGLAVLDVLLLAAAFLAALLALRHPAPACT